VAVGKEQARNAKRVRHEDWQQCAIGRSIEKPKIGPREKNAASENG